MEAPPSCGGSWWKSHIDAGLVVEAPAFMRGKERFSAPGGHCAPIKRFSAGNLSAASSELFRLDYGNIWWKPPHLCGGRSASALREGHSAPIMRFSAGTFRLPHPSSFARLRKHLVEAPAFMRGKERFSAPGGHCAPIVRFSAGNLSAACPSSFAPVWPNITIKMSDALGEICERK
jgi:hypothetical protein